MNLSESWKDLFFRMVMVDKAVEEIALQAHWLRDILKMQDPSQILLGTHLLFCFSPLTPLLIWPPDHPIHHTRGAIAVMHFQPCGQLSPALPNIHHWITGPLQLEKVFKIKSSHEPSTAKPSTIHSITEQYLGTSPGCSTYLAHLQWIPWQPPALIGSVVSVRV